MTDNKQRISELKAAIEHRRVQRSMAGLADPAAAAQAAQQPDAVEESAKAQIEQVNLACGGYTSGAAVKDPVDLPREQLHWYTWWLTPSCPFAWCPWGLSFVSHHLLSAIRQRVTMIAPLGLMPKQQSGSLDVPWKQ